MCSKYNSLIDCYSNGSRVRLHKILDLCTSLHQYVYGIEVCQNGERVKCCVPACGKDCFTIILNRNSHQRQVQKGILESFKKTMSALHSSLSFQSFDDYFEYVAQNSGLKNGYCLLVYDFCLRSGHHMTPQLEPNEYVYLFRGAREGAEYVIGKPLGKFYKLPTKFLQCVLSTKLTSMEIEDFLCVCSLHLKYIGAYSGISSLMKKYGIKL